MANTASSTRRPHGGAYRVAQLAAVALAFRRRSHRPAQTGGRMTRPGGGDPDAQALRSAAGDDSRERNDPPSAAGEVDRGRQAEKPAEIPARGWKDILIRSFKEFGEDQIPLISAGITFYTLLALFPATAALVSVYGLFADPAEVPKHLQALAVVLPGDALRFVGEQMTRIAATKAGGLSLGFVTGLLLSIWSANGAMKAMIAGLNIAYDETEKRNFVKKTATSLTFTIAFLVFGVLALGAIAAVPALAAFIGEAAAAIFGLLSWPLLVAGLGVGLALLYRYGPSRDRVQWRWISWGSAAAVVLWLLMSAAFSLYVANFANYNKTYGSLGAVIGFLTWLYLSAQLILLGAEINSEIEHQTAKDTTVGPERPLGQRGAVMADTIGEKQGK